VEDRASHVTCPIIPEISRRSPGGKFNS